MIVNKKKENNYLHTSSKSRPAPRAAFTCSLLYSVLLWLFTCLYRCISVWFCFSRCLWSNSRLLWPVLVVVVVVFVFFYFLSFSPPPPPFWITCFKLCCFLYRYSCFIFYPSPAWLFSILRYNCLWHHPFIHLLIYFVYCVVLFCFCFCFFCHNWMFSEYTHTHTHTPTVCVCCL